MARVDLQVDLKEVLTYALGGSVPERFLERLIAYRDAWDEELERHLEELAYELRPDLAVWEVAVDDEGSLYERRAPLLPPQDVSNG